MRGYYGALYGTPYLYSSDALKRYAKATSDDEEMRAIYHHMKRHEVWNDNQYSGFMEVTRKIQEHFYDEYPVSWDGVEELFTPYVQFDGNLILKPNGNPKNVLGIPYFDEQEEDQFDYSRYLVTEDDF